MKKGFTLIEMLGIIVILAVLSIIIVPTISKVVDNSKKTTAVNSAYTYQQAIDKAYASDLLPQAIDLDGKYRIVGNQLVGNTTVDILISGDGPTAGYVTYEDNVLVDACLVIKGYQVRYGENRFYTVGKGDCASTPETGYYYYTYDSAGNQSEPVYEEALIPSNWKHYFKSGLGPETEIRIYVKDVQTYTSLEACQEGNDKICIGLNDYSDTYGLLLKVSKTFIEPGASSCRTYGGYKYTCVPYTNKYVLYVAESDDPEPKKLYDTEEACKLNVSESDDRRECRFSSSGVVAYVEMENIYSPDRTNSDTIPSSCELLTSLDNFMGKKVLECHEISDFSFDEYNYYGMFSSMQACENHRTSLIASDEKYAELEEAECVAMQGDWYMNTEIKSFYNDGLESNDKSYDFCTLWGKYKCVKNNGYAIKSHDVYSEMMQGLEGAPGCEAEYFNSEVNSCNYTYQTVTPSGRTYYGFDKLKVATSEPYCDMYGVSCFKTTGQKLETELYVKNGNAKVKIVGNYETDKAALSSTFTCFEEVDEEHKEYYCSPSDFNLEAALQNISDDTMTQEQYMEFVSNLVYLSDSGVGSYMIMAYGVAYMNVNNNFVNVPM